MGARLFFWGCRVLSSFFFFFFFERELWWLTDRCPHLVISRYGVSPYLKKTKQTNKKPTSACIYCLTHLITSVRHWLSSNICSILQDMANALKWTISTWYTLRLKTKAFRRKINKINMSVEDTQPTRKNICGSALPPHENVCQRHTSTT